MAKPILACPFMNKTLVTGPNLTEPA